MGRLTYIGVRSRMKLSLATWVVVNSIHMVAGISCGSGCAACWKDGDQNGADVKFACYGDREGCGSRCPDGYSGIHCAKSSRCE